MTILESGIKGNPVFSAQLHSRLTESMIWDANMSFVFPRCAFFQKL